MGDALDIIVKKMNLFGKQLSERSNIYLKKAIDLSPHKKSVYLDITLSSNSLSFFWISKWSSNIP